MKQFLIVILGKGKTSPYSRPPSTKLLKTSPMTNHKFLANISGLNQSLDLPMNTSNVSFNKFLLFTTM